MIPHLTLQEAQGSIDSDSHGFVVLSPIYHRLIGPVAEPHVGPDGSRTLTAVQETHHQRDDGADGLHVLPEHRELYLREPHTKAVCTTYTIRSSDRKREKKILHQRNCQVQSCPNSNTPQRPVHLPELHIRAMTFKTSQKLLCNTLLLHLEELHFISFVGVWFLRLCQRGKEK